jgi:hypothetical protein
MQRRVGERGAQEETRERAAGMMQMGRKKVCAFFCGVLFIFFFLFFFFFLGCSFIAEHFYV